MTDSDRSDSAAAPTHDTSENVLKTITHDSQKDGGTRHTECWSRNEWYDYSDGDDEVWRTLASEEYEGDGMPSNADDTLKFVHIAVPGWYLDTSKNPAEAKFIGGQYTSDTVRTYAVVDMAKSEDRGAFCFRRVYNIDRETWMQPLNKYQQEYVPKSVVELTRFIGDPRPEDHVPLRPDDGMEHDVEDEESVSVTELDVDAMIEAARDRAALGPDPNVHDRLDDEALSESDRTTIADGLELFEKQLGRSLDEEEVNAFLTSTKEMVQTRTAEK